MEDAAALGWEISAAPTPTERPAVTELITNRGNSDLNVIDEK